MNTENLQNNASAPDAAACREKINSVITEIEHAIVGKRTEIVMLMTAMLSGSHVLIEDVPGTGKTTLAAAIAKATGLDFRRAQFTPDVMASDITGFNVYNRRLEEFEFRKGLVMCNLLLADEINRASPKTQSALLEAMEESRVTVDGVTYDIPDPFMVIATQNPTGYVGTYPLPEAQLDRFALKIKMGYPSQEDELAILRARRGENPLDKVQGVIGADDVRELRRSAARYGGRRALQMHSPAHIRNAQAPHARARSQPPRFRRAHASFTGICPHPRSRICAARGYRGCLPLCDSAQTHAAAGCQAARRQRRRCARRDTARDRGPLQGQTLTAEGSHVEIP